MAVLGGDSYFLEPFPAADPVYVCGAGHIARPTAQIAAMAGFRVIVLDDRAEFASPDRFPLAEEVTVLPSFDDCFAGRTLDADSSVVIVSRCHKQDRKILTQALRTDAGYIGMIGSSRKVAAVLDELVSEGFSGNAWPARAPPSACHRRGHARGNRRLHRGRMHQGPDRAARARRGLTPLPARQPAGRREGRGTGHARLFAPEVRHVRFFDTRQRSIASLR